MAGNDVQKKITFTAQDNGVGKMMDKLRGEAQELSKGLIKDAQKYSTSGKEQLRYIEDQIKAIERRNKLEREEKELISEKKYLRSQQASSAQDREKGKEQRKQDIENIQVSSKEDEMQTKLLRELIETTKSTAREEIRTDKKQATQELRTYDKLASRGRVDERYTPHQAFKRAVQRDEMGQVSASERESRGGFAASMRGVGQRADQGIGQMAGQRDEFSAAASAAALIGGAGAGIAANRLVQEGTQLEEARGRFKAITGVGMRGGDYSYMGKTEADYLEFASQLARARGSAAISPQTRRVYGSDIPQAAENLLATQEAYALAQGAITSLAANQRFDRNKRGTFGDVQNLIGRMRQVGALGPGGDDMSRLNELLQIQNTMTQGKAQNLMTVDSNKSINFLAELTKTEATGNQLQTMAQGIDRGLTSPQNDYQRAFNFSILRSIKPDASLFDLKKMQEGGFMEPKYLNKAMGRLTGGGLPKDLQKMRMMQYTGLSADQTETLFKKYDKGKIDFSDLEDIETRGKTAEDVKAMAEEKVSRGAQSRAKFSDFFAKRGVDLIDGIDGLTDQVTKLSDRLGEIFGVSGEGSKKAKSNQINSKRTSKLNTMVESLLDSGVSQGEMNDILPAMEKAVSDGVLTAEEKKKLKSMNENVRFVPSDSGDE